MIKKPGLIIYRGQDSIKNESFLNSYPHRMQKNKPKLNSIHLDEKIVSKLRPNKSYLQNIRLSFSDYIQTNRHLTKSLARIPSLKKLALQIIISEDEYEAGDCERKIAKFAVHKQLVKKMFTLSKRITDLQITLFDLIPIDSKILKNIRKLNKLANLHILIQELKTNDLSCLDNFVSSSRTKKSLPHLQSFNIHFAQERYLQHSTPEFRKFSQNVAKINSSLQSYPHPKSSLHFDTASSKSTVPILLSMLDSSPHLVSLEMQLDIAQDFSLLFDKLQILNQLSSLKLYAQGYTTRLSQCFQNFGKFLMNLKSLKEFDLFLSNSIQDANIVNYIFIDTLRFIPNLQKLTLKFDIANFDFDSFYLLSQSISSFSNLQSLKIEFYTHVTDSSISHCSRIPDLFKALGSLEALKVLHLTFMHLGQYLNKKAYDALHGALQNLVELRELKIDAQKSDIDDQTITKLAKVLPKLVNLENISLDLRFGNHMENYTLTQLLTSLTTLKHLRRIDLNVSCYKVDLTVYENVILLLNKLRGLCFCKLRLLPLKKNNSDVRQKFEEFLEDQFQYQDVCEFFF